MHVKISMFEAEEIAQWELMGMYRWVKFNKFSKVAEFWVPKMTRIGKSRRSATHSNFALCREETCPSAYSAIYLPSTGSIIGKY